MLLWKEFPADVRVEKEARALRAAGHDVRLLCRAEPDRPRRETVDGIDVVRVPHDPSTLSRWPKTLQHLLANVHPRWAAALDDAVAEWDADAIHVHDLPMVLTGTHVGDERDVPVVADLHENYPEAIRQWRRMDDPRDVLSSPSRIAEYTLRPVRRWKRIEREAVQEADHVLTVAAEGRDHYLDDCGVAAETVSVVGNTVDRDRYDRRNYREQVARGETPDPVAQHGLDPDEEFLVTYTGKFAPHRGLEAVVDGFPDLLDDVPEARLVLVGKAGTDQYGEAFRERVRERGIEDRVTFTGWVDFEAVPAFVAASDVCLVPHADTPHTATTLPHKLFQYMWMGKPVLASDVPPLERIVGDADAGPVIPAGDADAAADALVELGTDPEEAARQGENGRAAVEAQYHWGRDAERLRAIYRELGE
ncbi:glycosyltransferase family 4 protein [Halospeciosus flavus]|uniref:Glycosyltransferase family 4 protein n=2 Tax=Halospeciosus flavus TaxID=3032283 RepID=A0ABD5Z0Y4_9EURY